MRIAIVCNDTRGGIEPYAALGRGLARAGHTVGAVAPAAYAAAFERAGIAVAALSGPTPEEMRAATAMAERGTLATMRLMQRDLPERLETWTRETLAAVEDSELLIGGIGGMVIGLGVAEALGIPWLEAHLQPIGAPTGAYPGALLAGLPRLPGGLGNRLGHHLSDRALWMPFRGAMAQARRRVLDLDGPPPTRSSGPILYGFSRHVVPVPASGLRPRHVTGYWRHDSGGGADVDATIAEFIAQSGRLVAIGFGSMASREPAETLAMLRAATEIADVRAVVIAADVPQGLLDDGRLLVVPDVAHSWLFPRVSAIVHHGGAGTTGAALTAGVPSIVVPFAVDQPFWASRVAALGVGPAPIPRRALTARRLADAIQQALDDDAMAERARALGATLEEEDGVAAACAVIEELAPVLAPP